MRKMLVTLALALAIPGMAAQKNCAEVFPNDGVQSNMGLDGARCIQARIKNGNGDAVVKLKVSQDNSWFKFSSRGELYSEGGVTKPYNTDIKCEDVGAGITFECETKIRDANGKVINKETAKIMSARFPQLFQVFSRIDLNYVFKGMLPWEQDY